MHTRSASLLASSIAAALMLAASPAPAADNSQNTTTQASGQAKPADARSAKDAEKRWEQAHRASKIIGADIVNAKGEKVGTVKDLVMDDPASGQVTRVVVSVGGVGGLGDKLFAVPYSELKRDAKKDALVLNADSDLANSFNNDNWQALGNRGGTSTASVSNGTPASSNAASSNTPSSNGASSSAASSTATVAPSTDTSSTAPSSSADTSSGNAGNTAISVPGTSDTNSTK